MVLYAWRGWLILILCAAGCAAPTPVPAPRTPRPTPTAECRAARLATPVLNDLSEIVRAGEGAGDTTGATHITLFVGKAKTRLAAQPATTAREKALAAVRAAGDLAMSWTLQSDIAAKREAYEQALAAARQTIYKTCAR